MTNFVFSASTARAGSTLLAFLLNTHPDIASIAEMEGLIDEVDPETYLCSCGELLKECSFWNNVTQRLHDKNVEFSYQSFDTIVGWQPNRVVWKLQKSFTGNSFIDHARFQILPLIPGLTTQLQEKVGRNIALADAILAESGKKYLFDTSKDVTRIHYIKRYSGADLKVIHLVRDPRGVVASELRRNPKLDIRDYAKNWLKVNRKIEIQLETLPETDSLLVYYEDLATDSAATLNEIFNFLGVPQMEKIPNFRDVPHHMIGAKMRLENSSEISLDERWKTELTTEQLSDVYSMAGGMMKQYGYE